MSAYNMFFGGLCLLVAVGVSVVLEHLRFRCYWQSPDLYRRAGVFVCIGSRRYWVLRVKSA